MAGINSNQQLPLGDPIALIDRQFRNDAANPVKTDLGQTVTGDKNSIGHRIVEAVVDETKQSDSQDKNQQNQDNNGHRPLVGRWFLCCCVTHSEPRECGEIRPWLTSCLIC